MAALPGQLIHEFKAFEQDIDKVRLFLLTRKRIEETWVSEIEKLVRETTIKCPGAVDIWRGIRALVKTEIVQRKTIGEFIGKELTGLQEAKAPYSDELFKLMTGWANIEERHRKLYQEYSRAEQDCKDSFLQSKAANMPTEAPPSPHIPISPDTPNPNRRTQFFLNIIKKPSKAPPTQCPKNTDLTQADLGYRRAVMGLNRVRQDASDLLKESYCKLAIEEQEYLKQLQRVARLYGEVAINGSDISSACSAGGTLLSLTASGLSAFDVVSPIQEKTTLELENPYLRPFQYHSFKYHSTHNHVLFGIDLSHHTQYLEHKGTIIPSILGLLLEDIEVRGGDGVEAYTAQHYGLMQLAHDLEREWKGVDLKNQRLIEAADVTVSGELIKVRTSFQHSHGDLFMWIEYIFKASADRVPYDFSKLIPLSGDGPPRTEIVIVEPKPDIWEQSVWQTMVSHLQRLIFRGAPNRTRVQIGTVLAGKLGPLLVGCEDLAISVQFLKETVMGVGNPPR